MTPTAVLIVSGERRAALLQREAPDALVLTDPDALAGMESRFELAIVAGVLEQERWDRWLLQRIHRALRMHGRLVLHVPWLASVQLVADLPFLRYAGRKVLERALQRWRPGMRIEGAVHRRYRLGRLARTLETLGFAEVAGAAGATLVARKASSLPGVGGRPWPDAHAHRAAFASDYRMLERAREDWLAKHPAHARRPPRPLDPQQWSRARILVLSPHPDDELIGCGGTLCRLRDAGAAICILQATDGSGLASLSDLPVERRRNVRLEEAASVARALGADLELWRQPDGALADMPQAVSRLACLIDEFQPTHVFTPFLADGHADHRALSAGLAEALAASRDALQVIQYEVWGLVPANLYCDITDEAPGLERLFHLYERAMRADDFVHFCARRNLARALELTGRPGYAEAFLAMDGAQFRRAA